MPRGDGTGPMGRNADCGKGAGKGQGRGGRFQGAGGQCVCPQCGERTTHIRGQQCNEQKCPKCGSLMTRDSGVIE